MPGSIQKRDGYREVAIVDEIAIVDDLLGKFCVALGRTAGDVPNSGNPWLL
jgi:hypothetical protein